MFFIFKAIAVVVTVAETIKLSIQGFDVAKIHIAFPGPIPDSVTSFIMGNFGNLYSSYYNYVVF